MVFVNFFRCVDVIAVNTGNVGDKRCCACCCDNSIGSDFFNKFFCNRSVQENLNRRFFDKTRLKQKILEEMLLKGNMLFTEENTAETVCLFTESYLVTELCSL